MGRGGKNKRAKNQKGSNTDAGEDPNTNRKIIDNGKKEKDHNGRSISNEQPQAKITPPAERKMEEGERLVTEESKAGEQEWNQVTDKSGSTPAAEKNGEMDTEDARPTTASAKNKKKKEARKKNKKKEQLVNKMKERNASEIKCPKDLEDFGIVKQLDDLQYKNQNPVSMFDARKSPQSEIESSSEEDSSDDDNDIEDLDDYHVDGYHAAHVGEIIDSKYIILKKLGWGHFSTVWLAFKLSDKQLYALKIQKSAEKYIESAFEEEEILHDVAINYKDVDWQKFLRKHYKDEKLEACRDNTHNLQMFDQFFHHAPNGKHFVMAFEVLGKNLLSLIKKYDYRGIPIPIVRNIAKQILLGLDYLHRVCGVIHTDLKPENVVFALTERQKFELLYENVLKGPLIELFESTTPIILNSKQLKNQKKKERKKKKKAENSTQEETKATEIEYEAKQDLTSKTETIVGEFSQKIKKHEEKYQIVPEMQKIRNNSVSKRKPSFFSPETDQEPDITDVPQHPMKKFNRKYLRVSSQPRTHTQQQQFQELRPLTEFDVLKMKEKDLIVKLCDMGNACHIDKHYSDIIQTREYRSPEVILGGDYDQSADIWSLACMVFELVTGDYLFDPKKGRTYRKNDDHLALITELIGPCYNRNFMESTSKIWKFYDKKRFRLKNVKKLNPWPLSKVLLEKYRLKDAEARSLSSFLEAMLKWKPKDRASARDLLSHQWLKEADDYGVWMSKSHLKEFKLVNRKSFPGYIEQLRKEKAEKELAEKNRQERLAAGLESQSSSISDGSSSLDRRDKENLNAESAKSNDEDDHLFEGEEEEEAGDQGSASGSESSPYESGKTSSAASSQEKEDDEEWEDDDEK